MAKGKKPANDSGGDDNPGGNNKPGKTAGVHVDKVYMDEVTDSPAEPRSPLDDLRVQQIGDKIAKQVIEEQKPSSVLTDITRRYLAEQVKVTDILKPPASYPATQSLPEPPVPRGSREYEFVNVGKEVVEFDKSAFATMTDAVAAYNAVYGSPPAGANVQWEYDPDRFVYRRIETKYSFDWTRWQGQDELLIANDRGGPARSLSTMGGDVVTFFGAEPSSLNIARARGSGSYYHSSVVNMNFRLFNGGSQVVEELRNNPDRTWTCKFLDGTKAHFRSAGFDRSMSMTSDNLLVEFVVDVEAPGPMVGTIPPSGNAYAPTSDGGIEVVPDTSKGWGELPATAKRRGPKHGRGR
jgi:hypothetical protein